MKANQWDELCEPHPLAKSLEAPFKSGAQGKSLRAARVEEDGFTAFRIVFERYYPTRHRLEATEDRNFWFRSYLEFRELYDGALTTKMNPTNHEIMTAFHAYMVCRSSRQLKGQKSSIHRSAFELKLVERRIIEGVVEALDNTDLSEKIKNILRLGAKEAQVADERAATDPRSRWHSVNRYAREVFHRGIVVAQKSNAMGGDVAGAVGAGVVEALIAARNMEDCWAKTSDGSLPL